MGRVRVLENHSQFFEEPLNLGGGVSGKDGQAKHTGGRGADILEIRHCDSPAHEVLLNSPHLLLRAHGPGGNRDRSVLGLDPEPSETFF